MTDLGPTTERRFATAFAERTLLTAGETARLLDLDEKTLGALVQCGAVRAVLIGEKTRRYTEADLRAFLLHQTERSSSQPRERVNVTPRRQAKVVGFMEQKARRDAAKRPTARPG